MHDVAALAGVGQKTVSRVVNGEPNVSEDTRSKVEQAIATLKFVPHFGAGSLRRGGGRTQTLGVVVDAIDNPFSARIVRAIEAVASEHQVAVSRSAVPRINLVRASDDSVIAMFSP